MIGKPVETVLLCDCGGSQGLDRRRIEMGANVRCSRIHSALCTTERAAATSAIAQSAIIACQQEHALFAELAEDAGAPAPRLVDLRLSRLTDITLGATLQIDHVGN